jgi:general secretion pathway protein L
VSLLRIYATTANAPQRCPWTLVKGGTEPLSGEGSIEQLPKQADHVQLILPAEQVLFARAQVPEEARRRGGALLAFAVEEQTATEPDNNSVSWLGKAGDDDTLAVMDKTTIQYWRQALAKVGINNFEIHCEALLLPIRSGEWSLAWRGEEGYVRHSELEATATDKGDRHTPPLSLRLMLEQADERGARPTSIAVYAMSSEAKPDIEAWQLSLGTPLHYVGLWDWRSASPQAGVGLAQERQRWSNLAVIVPRLKMAGIVAGLALTIHALALSVDWFRLNREQHELQAKMETRFRAVVPDAVAVVDPALQMRRKLAEARHVAGIPDEGDFLPLIEKVGAAMSANPNAIRAASYESGRLTLEFAIGADAIAQQAIERLRQTGLQVDVPSARLPANGKADSAHEKAPALTIVVRTS